MATDFFGRELNDGDVVAFIEKDYRNFILGTISSIGSSKVTIIFFDENDKLRKTFRDHCNVIKKF